MLGLEKSVRDNCPSGLGSSDMLQAVMPANKKGLASQRPTSPSLRDLFFLQHYL